MFHFLLLVFFCRSSSRKGNLIEGGRGRIVLVRALRLLTTAHQWGSVYSMMVGPKPPRIVMLRGLRTLKTHEWPKIPCVGFFKAVAEMFTALSDPTGDASGAAIPFQADRTPGFVSKLYEIFCDGTHGGVCGWSREGTTILIQRISDFEQEVLPGYFKHNNFTSFVRQLNMYDFHKTVANPQVSEPGCGLGKELGSLETPMCP
jgi:hypothetical protein